MTLFALVRHLPTAWNLSGQLQGRCDIPIDAECAEGYRLPAELAGLRWLSSPLMRAVDTARHLGLHDVSIEPRLIEMDWGAWEGWRLAELRAEGGAAMAANEAAGLDFRPPGGESPRDVQRRIRPLLLEIGASGQDTGVITHKGVIRAILALATGWDMHGTAPFRLSGASVHLIDLDRRGTPSVRRLNVALTSQLEPAR